MYSSIFSLTSALNGGGWSTLRAGRFTPGTDPVLIFIGDWVGPGAGLDGYGKSLPHRDSIPGPSTPYRYRLCYPGQGNGSNLQKTQDDTVSVVTAIEADDCSVLFRCQR